MDVKKNLIKISKKGTLLHLWHGRQSDRNYIRREFILVKHKFNPLNDLTRNETNGLLALSNFGKRMEYDIKKYFLLRREDQSEV
jgi:hypothetical protein